MSLRWHPYFYKRVGRPLVAAFLMDKTQRIPLYVILSGEKRLRFAESKFC